MKKKKTYEKLVKEVEDLKRSRAAYKSENTKLRSLLQSKTLLINHQERSIENKDKMIGHLCEKIANYVTRSWWERFKDLFGFR